ncbi:rcc01693 family protein [Yoonia litorea]|uniref:Phage tail assembly chaperone protein, TAC n=1 Tax=Yoonia litorea TaxID=1123755 RepID=A0A1I6LXF2_9RHOB|nr:rcc01693 family protein [Yoonia litorea]SFS08075.1 phage conserved hypothetical protein [Yoonia litorea]
MDWRGLMEAGLHRLQLTPDVFWSLTPCELQLMLGLADGSAPMLRARFDDLIAAFPDLEKDEFDG